MRGGCHAQGAGAGYWLIFCARADVACVPAAAAVAAVVLCSALQSSAAGTASGLARRATLTGMIGMTGGYIYTRVYIPCWAQRQHCDSGDVAATAVVYTAGQCLTEQRVCRVTRAGMAAVGRSGCVTAAVWQRRFDGCSVAAAV